MLHTLSRACAFAAIAALLCLPADSWGQDRRVRHVQDDAKLFTQAARDKADGIIARIYDRHHKELFIQTVKEGPDKDQATTWAKERFNDYKVDGVYVVFCTHPKFFRIEIGDKTRSEGYFTKENIRKLEDIIKSKQSADEMLVRIADYTLDTMNAHPPKKANAPKGRIAVQQQPVVNPRGHNENAALSWVGWVCLIVAVLLVVWVIFAIIRAISGFGGGGGYGYGGGGYGYGGGGGGFLTGMLGGLFGSMAGMWMYNNFFGGHANYNTGDWGAGAGSSGTDGATGYDGDTGTGASGGGDDWGGGGGDAGGKGDAGGDWGGKGGGGGKDAGGGGKDAGGGGDWGGGGDVGGDAGGGGDAGAGCGGAGCGGGGCGGGGD